MKYVFVTFNYLTLAKSIKYITTQFGIDNSYIVYTDSVQPFPTYCKKLYNVLNITEKKVNIKNCNRFNRLKSIINDIINARICANTLLNLINKINDNVTLVVFKDSFLREATYIEKIFKKKSENVR